jgi:membrane associated rhomboid family serine protease
MITIIIIITTSIISFLAFSNRDLMARFQLNPWSVHHRKQYYRMISHAFVHADWTHLLVNMFVLFSFGLNVEYYFKNLNEASVIRFPIINFLFLYFSAIVIASLTTQKRYRNDIMYNAVGASGAVSAMVFICIFFNPWQKLYLFAIIPIPGIIFGILYLWYSSYMSKKSIDNINHDAHFIGAVYGFCYPILIEPKLFFVFIKNFMSFNF